MFRIGPPTRLAYDAVQEIRIKYRWEALDQENEAIKTAKAAGKPYEPELLENGDTLKQLLARSRYLLFKHKDKWTKSQFIRAKLLFERYPLINQAYNLSSKLGTIFRNYTSKELAYKPLAFWYDEVEKSGLESFRTVAKSIESHYVEILNFFNNRSTNASAESFNAKIKAFRSTSRGVRDISFFLFRLSKLYAWNCHFLPPKNLAWSVLGFLGFVLFWVRFFEFIIRVVIQVLGIKFKECT